MAATARPRRARLGPAVVQCSHHGILPLLVGALLALFTLKSGDYQLLKLCWYELLKLIDRAARRARLGPAGERMVRRSY